MHPRTVWTSIVFVALVALTVGITYGVMAPEVEAQQRQRWEYVVLSIYDIAPPVEDDNFGGGEPDDDAEVGVIDPDDEPDIVDRARTDQSGLQEALNRLGAEGWELVASDEAMWILKRSL